ncbi:uncharacterized protein FOMMEDRAFT_162478 [Fomitiporia mediterranea MF3/22]|uniref:uncharacterized protein n=1 Tax=Fomitiporia mediterranea (strain MF3/22) TaxID=694068 RepID=UPI00044074CC|nr:uncharacterized protein FOMMEDRAFT_162478 [Fomitiporia mediterranea MF3/22]EJC98124.1 hypothetical protein FOMMEDRAFT_162478 [Fomitiporia mediterranea MF3/22]
MEVMRDSRGPKAAGFDSGIRKRVIRIWEKGKLLESERSGDLRLVGCLSWRRPDTSLSSADFVPLPSCYFSFFFLAFTSSHDISSHYRPRVSTRSSLAVPASQKISFYLLGSDVPWSVSAAGSLNFIRLAQAADSSDSDL